MQRIQNYHPLWQNKCIFWLTNTKQTCHLAEPGFLLPPEPFKLDTPSGRCIRRSRSLVNEQLATSSTPFLVNTQDTGATPPNDLLPFQDAKCQIAPLANTRVFFLTGNEFAAPLNNKSSFDRKLRNCHLLWQRPAYCCHLVPRTWWIIRPASCSRIHVTTTVITLVEQGLRTNSASSIIGNLNCCYRHA